MNGKNAVSHVVLTGDAASKFGMQNNACQKHQHAQKYKFKEKTVVATFVQHPQHQDIILGTTGKSAASLVVQMEPVAYRLDMLRHVNQQGQFAMMYQHKGKIVAVEHVLQDQHLVT